MFATVIKLPPMILGVWPLLMVVILLAVSGVWISLRNRVVFKYHKTLLDDIRLSIDLDRLAGHEDWEWRFDAYKAVTYNDMMLGFWRSLDSFYPDQSFRRPKG